MPCFSLAACRRSPMHDKPHKMSDARTKDVPVQTRTRHTNLPGHRPEQQGSLVGQLWVRPVHWAKPSLCRSWERSFRGKGSRLSGTDCRTLPGNRLPTLPTNSVSKIRDTCALCERLGAYTYSSVQVAINIQPIHIPMLRRDHDRRQIFRDVRIDFPIHTRPGPIGCHRSIE